MRKIIPILIMFMLWGIGLTNYSIKAEASNSKCEYIEIKPFGKIKYCPDEGAGEDIVKYSDGSIKPVDGNETTKYTYVNGVAVPIKVDRNKAALVYIFDKYKSIIVGIYGLSLITMVMMFVKNILSLAFSASNPNERRGAIGGILWTGIATALLGSGGLIFSIIYNSFNAL